MINSDIKQLLETYRRLMCASLALLLAVVTLSVGWGSKAQAAQLTSRKITMSSSAPGASSTTYTIAFTETASGIVKSVDVDFCNTTPLSGDACTVPTGMTTTSASLTSQTGTSGWTLNNTTNGHLVLSGATFNSAAAMSFTIGGVTNPTDVGSAGAFYARVYTYAAQTNNYSSFTSPGTVLDYGGIALTTTNNITITSKVFETLTFCVYQTSCTSGTGNAPNLTLGDATTQALSISNNYINSNALYTLATNAGSGVVVVLKGNTLCRDSTPANCTTGSADPNTITPKAAGAASALAAAGTEQFAMCANKNGSTALTVATTYSDTVNNCASLTTGTYSGTSLFGWDNTAATGTSGSTVMSSTGAVPTVSGNFVFAAGISATTEAGIYSASINMIATATF
jgi:hypothetical protein